MTMPPRKPSDDPEFWDGIAVTQANRRCLFDVLALVRSDVKRNDGMNTPVSFDRFRETVYGLIDSLAKETNARASFSGPGWPAGTEEGPHSVPGTYDLEGWRTDTFLLQVGAEVLPVRPAAEPDTLLVLKADSSICLQHRLVAGMFCGGEPDGVGAPAGAR